MSDPPRPRPDAGLGPRLSALPDVAVGLPPERRDAWLDAEAPDDPALRDTIRRMLLADSSENGILAQGIAPAAPLVLEPEATLAAGTRVGAIAVIGVLGRGRLCTVDVRRDRSL